MANHNWTGSAPTRTQDESHVLASTAISDVITATINNSSVAYTTASTDNTAEALALATALTASDLKEFAELTFTPVGATIGVVGAANGSPYTITITNAGTGTVTPTTDQVSMSPNHWAAENFDSGSLPVSTDSVFINVNVSILYLLDHNAVDLALLTVGDNFTTASIGLPAINANGYPEYREQRLAIGSALFNIGLTDNASISGTIRLNCGTDATAFVAQSGIIDMLLNNVASTVDVIGDSNVSIAPSPLDTSSFATLLASGTSDCFIGTGVTVVTIQTQNTASITIDSNPTTINKDGTSKMIVRGSGTITTLNVGIGTLDYRGTGIITTLNISGPGIFTMVNSLSTADAQTININKSGTFRDPYGRRDSGSTSFTVIGASVDQVTIETPQDVTVTVTY